MATHSLTSAPMPKAVYMVAERIGLNLDIRRREAAEVYIEQNQDARLDLAHLRNSYYRFDESKTKKSTSIKKLAPSKIGNKLKLSAKLRKKLYKLSEKEKQQLNYTDFVMINKLWEQYALKILETKQSINIFHMDLHGCKLSCTASKNPTLVGAEGIVVQETKHTFMVIKPTNRLVTLPKRESIFEFGIADKKRYRIHGCNLLFTVQARTKVKYKQKRQASEV